jgi:hypothetical protein
MFLVDGVVVFFLGALSEREKKKYTRPWKWEQLRIHVRGRIITAVPGKGTYGLLWTHLATPTWKDQVWLMGLNVQSKKPLDIFAHLSSSNWLLIWIVYIQLKLSNRVPHNPKPRLHSKIYQVCKKIAFPFEVPAKGYVRTRKNGNQ